MKKTLDFIFFNAVWFSAVTGAAKGSLSLCYSLVVAQCLVHLAWNQKSALREIKFIVFIVIVGSIIDSLNASLGNAEYRSTGAAIIPLYPLWLSALWLSFSTLFSESLVWFKDRYALSGLIGFFGGPLSLYSAFKIGAVSFPEGLFMPLFINGIEWGILLPYFLYSHKRFTEVTYASPHKF